MICGYSSYDHSFENTGQTCRDKHPESFTLVYIKRVSGVYNAFNKAKEQASNKNLPATKWPTGLQMLLPQCSQKTIIHASESNMILFNHNIWNHGLLSEATEFVQIRQCVNRVFYSLFQLSQVEKFICSPNLIII